MMQISKEEIESFLSQKTNKNIRLGETFYEPKDFIRKTKLIINDQISKQYLHLIDIMETHSKNGDINAFLDALYQDLKGQLVTHDRP